MGNEKTEKVSADPMAWQQNEQQQNIHEIGYDVVSNGCLLLTEPFDHGICDQIAI